MPSHTLSGDINPQLGVLVPVVVKSSASLARFWRGTPRKVKAQLLVDTGATRTCLNIGIIQQLEIKEVGNHPVRNFMGMVKTMELFPVSLELRGTGGSSRSLPPMPVYATEFAGDCDFDGVLGRDILSRCHFSYQGRQRQFTLEF